MAADFDAIARPHVEALLEPGERIEGILASSMQKTFSGGASTRSPSRIAA